MSFEERFYCGNMDKTFSKVKGMQPKHFIVHCLCCWKKKFPSVIKSLIKPRLFSESPRALVKRLNLLRRVLSLGFLMILSALISLYLQSHPKPSRFTYVTGLCGLCLYMFGSSQGSTVVFQLGLTYTRSLTGEFPFRSSSFWPLGCKLAAKLMSTFFWPCGILRRLHHPPPEAILSTHSSTNR